MPISNYPNGFAEGVNIRGLPLLNSYAGEVFWVDSGLGGDGNKGTFDRPFSTLDYAIGRCTANNGDIIMVKPGHAETVAAAAGIAIDVAGVTIVCLGEGASRPTFTFSATTSTITMSAASCALLGYPIFTPSIDSVVSPLVISAADCRADIEALDASSTVEFIRAVLTTAAADKLTLNVIYKGDTGGNAVVNAVRLVGGNNVRVNVDFHGIASTAVVEFVTTACTNVLVTGYMFNSGTTDGSKLVVDTISGSTWYADIADGAAGTTFTGGSAAALAADDMTAITNALYGAAGVVTYPAGVAAANAVSIAEVLRYVQDQVINGTGTALAANTSLYGVLAGATGIPTFPTGAAAANDVSMAEVLRYIQDQVINGTGTALAANTSLYGVLAGATGIPSFPAAALPANDVSIAEVLREAYDQGDKAVTNTTAVLVTGTTIFTIAGGPIEILSLVARCVTTNDGTASTLQWSADPTDGAAATFSGASASLASVAAGGMVVLQGTTLATAPIVNASGVGLGQTVTNGIVVGAGIITSTVAVGSTTGTWQHHMRYRPLARGVTVS